MMLNVANRLHMEPLFKAMNKLSPSDRPSPLVMGATSVVGVVTAIQLVTDWDPLGRCFVFWRQLRGHVRHFLFILACFVSLVP
jgi:hypothetical protein